MKTFALFRLSALLATAAVCSSCTLPLAPITLPLMAQNKRYHEVKQSGQDYDLAPNAKVRVLEFDDMGELWDRQQLAEIERDLRKTATNNPHGVLLVTYVHGWEHNADPKTEGGNLNRFKETIKELGDAYAKLNLKRDVVGVYIGWRGRKWRFESPSSPILAPVNFLTKADFFHGKAGGHRVGGAACTHALHALGAAARTSPKSKVVVVGHSFGGLVVEHALFPAIAAGITQKEYRPPADVILMVNQAENGINASKLITAMQHSGTRVAPVGSDRSGLPLLVSLASKTDKAVKHVFRIGTAIGRFGLAVTNTTTAGRARPKARPDDDAKEKAEAYVVPGYSQETMLYRSPGYVDAFQSFCPIKLDESQDKALPKGRATYFDVISANYRQKQTYDASAQQFTSLNFITPKGAFSTKRRFDSYNQTPYWIMQAEKEFLDGHSGFWERAGDSDRGSYEVVALITVLTNLDRHIPAAQASQSRPVKVMSAQ